MTTTSARAGAYHHLWAKSLRPEDGGPWRWSSLWTHLTDTAAVMRLLWDWAGAPVRRVIAADAAGDDTAAREVAVLAASLHDIGKGTPAFAGQVEPLRIELERQGYRWPAGYDSAHSRDLPHSVAGHHLVEQMLIGRGVDKVSAEAFAVIIGGHHGVPPTKSELNDVFDRAHLLGDGAWREARVELVEDVVQTLGLEAALDSLATVRLSDASQILLTALVVMADWIASNADLFPLVPIGTHCQGDPTERAARAWREFGFPERWLPTTEALTADATALLRARFGVDYEANRLQQAVLEAARGMAEPGLLLIEAVMGGGKTEASLLAAEVFAAKFGCSGVFYGLPTRATADAMLDRVLVWWQNVPGLDRGDRNIALRHGNAGLNDTYRGLPRRSRRDETNSIAASVPEEAPLEGSHILDVGRDEPSAPLWDGRRTMDGTAVAHYWTSGRKKAAFADTVVGTIDHELLAALRSRHVVLRHLGLARQVVVLDEVHAADTWMFVYLERALEWLGRYGVPVIAMSATLPPDQRQRLVDAYENGRRWVPPSHERRETFGELPQVPVHDAYPLVTALSAACVTQRSADPGTPRPVSMAWLTDDVDHLVREIEPVVTAGGCVLVIRNTVRRAVETYRALQPVWGEAVTLAHSRFIGFDRLRKDDWLRSTFGRGAGDRSGRIVVATQVAEQSLDIDFDLLVTDLAPIDLILQRVGRVHRHLERTRPTAAQTPRCLVTGVAPRERGDVPEVDRGSAYVYGEYRLLRSAALLDEIVAAGGHVTLPSDVPSLVRRCYSDEPVGPPVWQLALDAARSRAETEQAALVSAAGVYRLVGPGKRRSLIGTLSVSVGEAETSTDVARQVRRSDGGFEVVLLRYAVDGLSFLPHLGDTRRIPTDRVPERDVVRLLARSMVRVPAVVTSRPEWTDRVLNDLSRNYFSAWQRDAVLGGQLILLLDESNCGTLGPFQVTYHDEVGLGVQW